MKVFTGLMYPFYMLIIAAVLAASSLSADETALTVMTDDMIPGTLTQYATLQSIGFEWEVQGDTNHNAQCLVQYRIQGSSSWNDALPLYRVDFEGANTLAGSILFLEPGTTYEVELDLFDPDGGAEVCTVTIATRAEPRLPTGGITYHVEPGSGGGDGSLGNPFQGIPAAQSVAQPGDIFLLHAGDYGGRVDLNEGGDPGNYVVWKAAGDGEVIFDGVDIRANYIWLEGVKVVAGGSSLKTDHSPRGVVIIRNTFINCHYCVHLSGNGSDFYIADNDITGDVDPGSGTFSGEGIELNKTSGHVVAYNRISRVADGISYPRTNVDIYGNDIFDTSDDGIEGDYGLANIRIWGNRISNPLHNGISFQPMNGAPWYVLYNQVAAPGENVIKLRDRTDRVLLAHNTLVAWSGPVSSESRRLLTFQSNNNLWISVQDRFAWENGSNEGTPTWRTNLDYDGFDWGNYQHAFKWVGRYVDVADFYAGTGLQEHGIRVDRNIDFETFDVPDPPPAPVPFQFMTLASGSNAIDVGIALPGINDGYGGSAPDLGAYEYGQPLPHYGPRPVQPTSLGDPADRLADGFTLGQNYPNPFNPETVISYALRNSAPVQLKIYNQLGQQVRTLVSSEQSAGEFRVTWDGTDDGGSRVVSGVYLYRLQVGEQSRTRRMLLLR